MIGTGSELQLAFAAAEALDGEGIPTRVVSLPCWERFELQDQAYRDGVLPPAVRKRVSVEIGVSLGWERWVGDEGAIIGLDHFGASAPAGTIFEHFGFTSERVTDVARRVVRACAVASRRIRPFRHTPRSRPAVPTLDRAISRPTISHVLSPTKQRGRGRTESAPRDRSRDERRSRPRGRVDVLTNEGT